ncbi:MAG TPA: serine/threonine-protein kinase, partial [Gemmatimonadales bacterium]|nr:serine/threonine-protein kinase [Gemmatimonadales bacterium]
GPGYELGERIGAGGFAEVFKARDLRLKRDIAVKMLRPDLGLTPGMLERFRREAEVVAALRHPNIVPIYDVGEAEGLAFIIMPFIAGESLRAKMEREGAMPLPEVRRILREAASGLGAAHTAGVIHRDVKPENIMLEGPESRVLLMDFGIAKAVGGDEDTPATEEGVAPALTSTGIIVGTPQYMSPEQACGDKTIDARTDQYSLAVVGYRMLSGTLPFEGESTRAVLYQQLVAEPAPLIDKVPGLPGGVVTAIQRAMAKEPRERFETMLEFAGMLEDDAAPVPLSAVERTKVAQAAAKTQSSQRRQLVMAVFAVIAVGALIVNNLRGGNTAAIDTELIDSSLATPLAAAAGTDSTAMASAATATTTPTATTARQATTAGTKPRALAGKDAAATAAAPSAAPTSAPTARRDCAALVAASAFGEAVETCTAEANAGNAGAMRRLGEMYDRGNGVTQDPAQAFSWYRKAAPNDAEAKFQLSKMYDIGRGTPRDGNASITWLREAAAMNHPLATMTLAFRLETGGGMKRDWEESAIWYRKAADRGDATAMLKLAEFAAKGRGMKKDEGAALEWYRKAGDRGSSEGAYEAAQSYLRGRGTPKDEAQGVEWLKKAAALGNKAADEELKKRGA